MLIGEETPSPKGLIAVHRLKWIVALPVAALLLAMAGTWTYINVFSEDAPARLTLEGSVAEGLDDNAPATTATTAAADAATPVPVSFDGTWTATTGSQAGYRVKEVLFGQSVEAVGRTTNVDGALTISDTVVETAAISIDLASVTSDESRRDSQFQGRIMNTSSFPTATFELAEPITLDAVPPEGTVISTSASGDLTIRGKTKRVSFELRAQLESGAIKVNGAIPFTLADFGIPDPSNRAASVQDHGEIEFLVVFAPA